MEYFLFGSGVILFCAVVGDAIDSRVKLTVVTNGEIAQALYRRIRREVPNLDETSKDVGLNLDTKVQICRHVTSSSFYSHKYNEFGVYTNDALYQRLMNYDVNRHHNRADEQATSSAMNIDMNANPERRTSNYENRDSDLEVVGIIDEISLREVMHTNPILQADVYPSDQDKDPLQEHLFTCLTVDPSWSKDTAFAYYISEEYNLSDTPNPYLAGRFVFRNHGVGGEDKIVLGAVAEEPAKSLSNPGAEIEHEYLKNRGRHQIASNQSDDPICKLNKDERLRACALVLNSEYFEKQLKFVPSFENIDERKCVKKRITFHDEAMKLESEMLHHGDFEEWMITCRSFVRRDDDFQYDFFLSRVYNSINEVFVYRRETASDSHVVGTVFLENLFGNVRFRITGIPDGPA